MPDAIFIIALIGITIFAGFLASLFFQRTKIPDVLFLIFLGMLIGPVFGYIDSSSLLAFAPLIGTIALIIIVFEGGLKLDFYSVIKELPNATAFTVIVCTLTAVFSMIFTFFLGFPLLQGLLLGFIVAGTSFEIIVPLVNRLNVSNEAKTFLELESTINDSITIIAAIALVQLISLKTFDVIDPLQKIASAFSIAIVLGFLAAFIWAKVMSYLKDKPYHYLLTIASAFLLYVGAEVLGGNGITAILVFGLALANYNTITTLLNINSQFKIDYSIETMQTEVSFFVRAMFFVYMGLVFDLTAFGSQLITVAFAIFFAIIIARFLSVKLLMKFDKSLKESKPIIMAMLPRGLATAVLASLPLAFGLNLDFTNIVLLVVVLTNVFATIMVFYFEYNQRKKAAGKKPKQEEPAKKFAPAKIIDLAGTQAGR
ncbi:MAG: cation:proton antiporter [archaeon]